MNRSDLDHNWTLKEMKIKRDNMYNLLFNRHNHTDIKIDFIIQERPDIKQHWIASSVQSRYKGQQSQFDKGRQSLKPFTKTRHFFLSFLAIHS